MTVDQYSQPTNGTVSLASDGSFVYTPNPNFSGSDSFTYIASDGSELSNTATVAVTVNDVNLPPVAVDDSATTAPGASVTIDVLANDSDPDGDALSVAAAGNGAKGTVTVNADGTITYTHTPGAKGKAKAKRKGKDSLSYTVVDGMGNSASATVTITVESAKGGGKGKPSS